MNTGSIARAAFRLGFYLGSGCCLSQGSLLARVFHWSAAVAARVRCLPLQGLVSLLLTSRSQFTAALEAFWLIIWVKATLKYAIRRWISH